MIDPGQSLLWSSRRKFNRSLISFCGQPSLPKQACGRAAYCIVHFAAWLKLKLRPRRGNETLHHNFSSWKAGVTTFYRFTFKKMRLANGVPRGGFDSPGQTACRCIRSLRPVKPRCRSCNNCRELIYVAALSCRPRACGSQIGGALSFPPWAGSHVWADSNYLPLRSPSFCS